MDRPTSNIASRFNFAMDSQASMCQNRFASSEDYTVPLYADYTDPQDLDIADPQPRTEGNTKKRCRLEYEYNNYPTQVEHLPNTYHSLEVGSSIARSGSLQGRISPITGTTSTNSSYSTPSSIFEDILQLLRASQLTPPSFQRQTSVLRVLYPLIQKSRDVEEVGQQIGLKRHEILTWFDVEKTRRDTWSLPSNTSYSILPRRKSPATLPTSMSFLEQICLLRESFDQNHLPSHQDFLQLSRETCIDAIDVYQWFEAERDVQCQYLLDLIEPIQGFSKAEVPYQSLSHGSGVKDMYPVPVRPSDNAAFDRSFPCLSCPKQFKSMSNWNDHQRKVHFSKEIYECWEDKIEGSPCLYGPVLRADNLRTHLIKEHQHQSGQELNAEVAKRARKIHNLYHEKCGFDPCQKDLKDFETSMKHIAEHISSGYKAMQWIHACRSKEHKLPLHSKQSSCRIATENKGNNREREDDEDGNNDNDERGHTGAKQDGRTQSLLSATNLGTQNKTATNQSQQSHDGSDTITELTDSYSGVVAQSMSPTTVGDATSIIMSSDDGIRSLGHIESILQQQHFNFNSRFKSIRFLGRGTLGFVEKVVCIASHKICVRKTLHRSQLIFKDQVDVESLNEELETLMALRHPNLSQLIGSHTAGDFFCIFMSPVADENLASFFHASENTHLSQIPEKQKSLLLEWMGCLQSAMTYLHKEDIIHQNIKPQNILIKGDRIFLSDIQDFTRYVDEESIGVASSNPGSTYYAPETAVYGILDAKSNTFSLGCIFTEMLTCHFGRLISHFERFRASETGNVSYHLTLDRTNKWIDGVLADDILTNYDLLFKALHNTLIETSSERPNIDEIQLSVQGLLRERTRCTTELGEIFSELGLIQYLDIFIEQGFDEWDAILNITESDFDTLGVKLGHRKKFRRKIAETRNAPSNLALLRRTPTVQNFLNDAMTDGIEPDVKDVKDRLRESNTQTRITAHDIFSETSPETSVYFNRDSKYYDSASITTPSAMSTCSAALSEYSYDSGYHSTVLVQPEKNGIPTYTGQEYTSLLPPDNPEMARVMRKIPSCWQCRLVKVNCSTSDPCISVAGLYGIIISSLAEFFNEHLSEGAVSAFIQNVEFISNDIPVEMSSGPHYPIIHLTAYEFQPLSQEFPSIGYLDPTITEDKRQIDTEYCSLPIGLYKFSQGDLRAICRDHIKSIIAQERSIDEVTDGDTSIISWKIFEAIDRYRRSSPGNGKSAFFRKATTLPAMHWFMRRIIIFTKSSAEKALEKLRKSPIFPFAQPLTSTLLNLQIKQAMQGLLHDTIIEVLDGLEEALTPPKFEASWAELFCVVMVLCNSMEEVQIAAINTAITALSKDPEYRSPGLKICQELDETPFKQLTSLFHLAYKTKRVKGNQKSQLGINPIRYGLGVNPERGITQEMDDLVNEIKLIMTLHNGEMAKAAEHPSFDPASDLLAYHIAVRKRNSGRLVSKFLLSFVQD